MTRLPLFIALLALPVSALAQDAAPVVYGATPVSSQAETGQPPQRIRSVTVVGDKPCPKSEDPNEVVVCARIDENEQFRVPKALRESPPSAANQSWVNRTATMDEVGREAGGLPNTCSPVGTGGQTGCTTKMLDRYAADRRAKRDAEASIP